MGKKAKKATTSAPVGTKSTEASKVLPKAPKADTGKPRGDGAKRASGLDAAAKILAKAVEPLSCKAITKHMIGQGLWQTKGKTPAATIYSAIIREIAAKGQASRFKKVDRGRFTLKK